MRATRTLGRVERSRVRMIVALVAAALAATAFLLTRDDGAAPAAEPREHVAAPEIPVEPIHARTRQAPSEPPLAPTAPAGVIAVRVVASEVDAPIAGAEIDASGPGDAVAHARTGDDGTARLEGLADGTWYLDVSAPGRAGRESRVELGPGATASTTFRLPVGAALALRAEDQRTHSPIADARVSVSTVGDAWRHGFETGDDGQCVVLAPAGSLCRVVVSTSGWYVEGTASVRVGSVGTTTPLVVGLATSGRMTGVIRAPDGTAVPGARIGFNREDASARGRVGPNFFDSSSRWVDADDDGHFVVDWLKPGVRYHAFATCGSTSRRWARSVVAEDLRLPEDGGDLVHDFDLRSWGNVVVRVVDAERSPVSHAVIRAFQPPFDPGTLVAATESAPGEFQTGHLVPGHLQFVVSSESGDGEGIVDLQPGAVVELTIQLANRQPDSMVVVEDDAGRPVAGAIVTVKDERTGMCLQGLEDKPNTDQDGRAPLPTWPWGAVIVNVRAPGLLPAEDVRLDQPGRETRIVLRRPAVVTFAIPEPLVAEMLKDERARVFVGRHAHFHISEIANASGVGRAELVPVGDTTVWFLGGGGKGVVARNVRLAPGTTVDLGTLEFPELQRVRGRVVDAAGRGVPRVSVGLDVARQKGWNFRSVEDPVTALHIVTRDDGGFEVDWSPDAGLFPIYIDVRGYAPFHGAIPVVRDKPMVVTLDRGGVVWGEVSDSFGAPEPHVEMHLFDATGGDAAIAMSNEHGWFETRVAAGRYVLRADGCDDAAVDVADGGEAHVRLVRRAQ